MAEHIKTIYGPATEEQVSPDILADRRKRALEAKGIEFKEDAGLLHIIQASLDFVEGRAGSGANTSQTAESARRRGSGRRQEHGRPRSPGRRILLRAVSLPIQVDGQDLPRHHAPPRQTKGMVLAGELFGGPQLAANPR